MIIILIICFPDICYPDLGSFIVGDATSHYYFNVTRHGYQIVTGSEKQTQTENLWQSNNVSILS